MPIISLNGHRNIHIETGKLDTAFRITALVVSHFILRSSGTKSHIMLRLKYLLLIHIVLLSQNNYFLNTIFVIIHIDFEE